MHRFATVLLLLATGAAAPAADTRTFMLTGFERIRIDGPYDVRVVTGPSGGHAEGDKRALDRLVVRVEGRTLIVSAGANNWNGWRGGAEGLPRITVSVPELRTASINGGGRLSVSRMRGQRIDLSVNGAGALTVDAADADQLFVTLTGTGIITIAGRALRATFGSYGAGSIDAGALIASDLTVRSSSSGDSRFAALYTAKVSAAGLGAVTVGGTPKCIVSGPGPVYCGDNAERRK